MTRRQDVPVSEGEEEPDLEYLDLLAALKKSSLDERYFGPSSNIYFLRRMVNCDSSGAEDDESSKWTMHPVRLFSASSLG